MRNPDALGRDRINLFERVRCCYGSIEKFGDGYLEDEEQFVANSTLARRKEFHAGRAAARSALMLLNEDPCVIPMDKYRRPIWPAGVTGSISHCSSVVGAAVALIADVKGIGFDIEAESAVTSELWDRLLTPNERILAENVSDSTVATVIFSCKEAVYKAASPLTDEFLDFLDVEIEIQGPQFRARCKKKKHSRTLINSGRGRVATDDGLVRSLFAIP